MNFLKVLATLTFGSVAAVCVAFAQSQNSGWRTDDPGIIVYQSQADQCQLQVLYRQNMVLFRLPGISSTLFVSAEIEHAGENYVRFTSPYRDESLTVTFVADASGALNPEKAIYRNLKAERESRGAFQSKECRSLVKAER